MLPSVTPVWRHSEVRSANEQHFSRDGARATAPTAAPSWQPEAAAIDELMFLPSRWFALDVENQQVPRVVVASLVDGLELVAGSDRVASVVGTLRPEFVVVDIDVDDARGREVMTELESWVRGQGLWHVVRPSGGAPGRFHIYICHDGREDAVRERAARIRGREGLPAKAIDVRRKVRPLSAPHRLGSHPRPLGILARSLARLTPSVQTTTEILQAATGEAASPGTQARRSEPVINGVRGRRPLPLEWARYLATGEEPPLHGDDGPSTYGARVTAELVRAGYQADEAWAKIVGAHQDACTHARRIGHGRDWWITYQWNPAVEDLQRFRLEHGADTSVPLDVDADPVVAAVQAGRAALEVLQWRWGPRARPGIVLVAHTLMDRMLRENTTTVPCPQRNLETDTGLCRPTIAKALRALHEVLGTLQETFDPGQRERSSYTFALADIDELHDVVKNPGDEEGVGQDLPPVLHTPTPPGLWPLLGPTAHALWRTLGTHPVTLEVAVARAGLTHGPGQAPTVAQLRTAARHLTALAQAGTVQCDDAGRWSLAPVRKAHTPERIARAHAVVEPIQARIALERAAYRAEPGYSWRRARAESIELERVKAAGRYDRWRQALTAEEYAARSRAHAARFSSHSHSPAEQARLKDGFAHRRAARLGPSEAHRHDTWCRSLSDLDYADRAAERQHRYGQLHPIDQAHHAQMWAEHRRRWNIPRGHPDETADRDQARAATALAGASA